MFVIVIGTVGGGFDIRGPYTFREEAIQAAETHCRGCNWEILELRQPY